MADTIWQTTDSPPFLLTNEVHIWRVWLDQPAAEMAGYQSVLTVDELGRAGRFYFDRDRRRYVVTRGRLRQLLGYYLGCAPTAVTFSYTDHGKPELVGEVDVQFNVSHAGQVALLAFCRGTAVGVDVEVIRPLSDMDAVAHRSFSSIEYEEYMAARPDLKPTLFFNCWTRKEAFIKAVGEGLSYPLRAFSVTVRPGEAARFRQIEGRTAVADQWTLQAFEPAKKYAGALALKGSHWQTRFFTTPGFP